MKKVSPSLYILVAAVLWGCIALFYDALVTVGYSSLQVVFLRVFTAAVLMGGYILFKDPSLFKVRLCDIWMFLGSGIVSLAFFNFCYFSAMDRVSHSIAAVLLYTAPMFVMLMSAIFFHDKITPIKILSLVFALFGCVFVSDVFFESFVTPVGLLFGLGSGIGYALYSIFGTVALKRYKSETITFYSFLFASVGVLPFCGFAELTEVFLRFPMESTFYGLGIGFFICFLPYLFYTKGLSRVRPAHASVIATLEPVVATVVGVCFLQNTLSIGKVIGIFFIVIAVLILNFKK